MQRTITLKTASVADIARVDLACQRQALLELRRAFPGKADWIDRGIAAIDARMAETEKGT